MRLFFLAAAAAASTLAITAPASAQDTLPRGVSMARLATPPAKGFDEVIDGRIWRCDDGVCRADARSTATAQSTARECASAAKRLGAFSSYQSGSDSVTGPALETCNAKARKR